MITLFGLIPAILLTVGLFFIHPILGILSLAWFTGLGIYTVKRTLDKINKKK